MNFSNNFKKIFQIQKTCIYDILYIHTSHSNAYASVIQHYIDKVGPIEIDGNYVKNTC